MNGHKNCRRRRYIVVVILSFLAFSTCFVIYPSIHLSIYPSNHPSISFTLPSTD